MIKIYKYGEVPNSEIFARDNIASNVEGIVTDIIADVVKNGDAALYAYAKKFDKADLTSLEVTPEEIEAKFGFLVEAYKYGAPPHGGSGMGLDRLAMVMSGADSLRDVLAFPKVQNASELMSGCPAPADAKALADLSIAVIEEE